MKIKFFILGLFFSSFVLFISTSCQKKTDCKLIITTIDSAGNPLPLADVKLFANVKTSSGATVQADLKAFGVSDGSGMSTYTFKLPAILDISATKDTKSGIGIIKLEEGKTVEKVVTVK